jgi:hypothetical protein
MAMKVCILDINTKDCVATVMLDSIDQWIPVDGQELANNHDGGIGMRLTEEGWISIVPTPPMTWENIRESRNYLLMNCDWTVLPDSPLTSETRQEWVDYRQSLRDITSVFSDPNDVIWPLSPDAN